ncbi:synapse differentiation-inducing gene protein 1-like [Acanthaster planci]|uniref:Synapse differentiation-inducing gene protein 1-like n=1 Tax=Acanthaster planci TaxID=133434 RepID=A0A8B7YP23_ACAPL|nr:synapse differentiation-inducing gene protein 1-like [Acanthaster planci]
MSDSASDEFPYSILKERTLEQLAKGERPGTFYVSTVTTPPTNSQPKGKEVALTLMPSDTTAAANGLEDESKLNIEEPGAVTGCEEPRCEIIIHTSQEDDLKTLYATDYFTFALFVFLCCFLPFGVAGLVKNHQSRVKAVEGDYDGAVKAAKEALRYATAGCIIGTVCYLGFAAFGLAVMIMSVTGDVY